MAPGARLHLTDVLGAWRVDPSRHTADTNRDGQLLVSEDVVVTRNFDDTVFDRAYYQHFYGRSRRRIASEREEQAHCDFICAYLEYLGQPVRNVVTCGEGVTRRDDGGESDHDEDGYEDGRAYVCRSPRFVRGDVNGDRHTNVSDGLVLLAALFEPDASLQRHIEWLGEE